MLEVDPDERIGAEECLEMQYLEEEEGFCESGEKCGVSPAATEAGEELRY